MKKKLLVAFALLLSLTSLKTLKLDRAYASTSEASSSKEDLEKEKDKKDKLDKEYQNLDKQVKESDKYINRLEDEAKKLKSEVETYRSYKKDLEDLASKEEEKKQVDKKIQELEAEKAPKASALIQEKIALGKLKDKLLELENNGGKESAEYIAKEREVKDKEREVEGKEREVISYDTQIEEAGRRRQSLEAEIGRAKAIGKDLNTVSNELTQKERSLGDKNATISLNKQTNQDLKAKKSSVAEQVAKLEAKIKKLQELLDKKIPSKDLTYGSALLNIKQVENNNSRLKESLKRLSLALENSKKVVETAEAYARTNKNLAEEKRAKILKLVEKQKELNIRIEKYIENMLETIN